MPGTDDYNAVVMRSMAAHIRSLECALDTASGTISRYREVVSACAWAISRAMAFAKAGKTIPEDEAHHIRDAEEGLRASLQWKTVAEFRP